MEPNFTRYFNLDYGQRVILRGLERKDLIDLVDLYNSLVSEDIDIVQDRQIAVEEGVALMEDIPIHTNQLKLVKLEKMLEIIN